MFNYVCFTTENTICADGKCERFPCFSTMVLTDRYQLYCCCVIEMLHVKHRLYNNSVAALPGFRRAPWPPAGRQVNSFYFILKVVCCVLVFVVGVFCCCFVVVLFSFCCVCLLFFCFFLLCVYLGVFLSQYKVYIII